MSETIIVTFTYERDTKNKVRFTEVVADGASPAIGKLYLDQGHYEEIGKPKKVTVTITKITKA